LLESQQWQKYIPLQSDFPQHPKFDKPNIQQQEIAPHEPFTTLVDLHKILLPIADFENKKVLFNLQSLSLFLTCKESKKILSNNVVKHRNLCGQ
jgi:hypothetical protein